MKALDRETEALIREWSAACNLDYQQAKVLFFNLKQAMLVHLAVNLKSVDLGFAWLHPRPFRANWANYLIQRFPFIGQWVRGKSRAEMERIFREAGFKEEMHKTILLAVRNGLMYFGLEVVPKVEWWRLMLSAQRRLLALLGPAKYCKAMGIYVSKAKEKFVAAHLAHLHQIGLPCGGLSKSRYYGGNQVLVEYRDRGKVRASSVPVRLGSCYHSRDAAEFQTSECQVDGDPAADRVLPLSDIQSPAVDLRHSIGELAAPGEGD